MQTISLCCGDVPLWRVLLQVQAMMWAQRRPSGRKAICDGAVKLYLHLLRTSHGDDFSYASQEGMARKFGVHIRTIERWLNLLIESGFISKGKKFVGCWRRGFFLNAHKMVVAVLKGIDGIIVRLHGGDLEENEDLLMGKIAPELGCEKRQVVGKLPPPLTIRKGVNEKNLPPYPPQAEVVACAAMERENGQKAKTEGEAPQHRRYEKRDGRGGIGTGETSRLRFDRGTAKCPEHDGLRREPGTLQRSASAFRTESASWESSPASGMTATWQAALALLLQRLPEAEVKLWLAPIRAMASEAGLRLDCPDRYAMAHIEERFGQAIGDALRQLGVNHFIFSFGVEQMERQRKEERQERDKAAAAEKRRLEELASRSWEEQFAELAALYPRKTCGLWLAKKLFGRLRRRGELPEIGVLLNLVRVQSASEDWQRDRGRWIPGLYKWLQNRPWWNIGDERQKARPRLRPC